MSQAESSLDLARLAQELAARASRIVPPSVSVRAEGAAVLIEGRDGLPSAIYMFRDTPRPVADLVGTLAYNVLNSLQDVVARETTEPWPARDRKPSTAVPQVAIRDGAVHMWYGDETSVLVELQPLPLTNVLTPSADR